MSELKNLENQLKKKGYVIKRAINKSSLDFLQKKILELSLKSKPSLKKVYKRYKQTEIFLKTSTNM